MTIKIPVQADTGSSKQALNEVERSFDAIAKAVESIEAAANRTAASLDKVVKKASDAGEATKKVNQSSQRSTGDPASRRGLAEIDRRVEAITRNSERLSRLQGILGKTFGREFSADEAEQFARGFEINRRMSPRLREFRDAVDFYENTGRGFSQDRQGQRRAAQYRRSVMNRSMVAGDVPIPEGRRGPGMGLGGADMFGASQRKGMSRMRAMGGGMLALAGITTVAALSTEAVNLSTQEGAAADTLKRSMGDLGIEFERLRDEVRDAGSDLGVASIEAQQLALQFAKVSNASRRDDVAGETRNAIGFARAYGLDPAASATFFGMMRHTGVTGGDDRNSRRMASLIADAISSSGSSAKADELLSAVANFTAQAARATLNRPNTEGYLGLLSGMAGTRRPGMSPQVAANIIGAADSATRRGGAMGEASQNFLYAALSRGNPGMDPLNAQILWEEGLFGSARSAFGKGSVAGSYLGEGFLPARRDDDTTVLEMVKRQLDRMGMADPRIRADSIRNLFGLSSTSQAMFFDSADPATLGATQTALKGAGVNIDDVGATAWQPLAEIARSGDERLRGPLLAQMLAREDLDDTTKGNLRRLAKKGDLSEDRDYSELRNAMVRTAATYGQEETDGEKIRAAVTDMKNELTKLGAAALPIFIGIRSGVAAIVGAVAPGSEAATRFSRSERMMTTRTDIMETESAIAESDAKLEAMRAGDDGNKSWADYDEHDREKLRNTMLRGRLRRARKVMADLKEAEAADRAAALKAYTPMAIAVPEGEASGGPAVSDVFDPLAGVRAGAERRSHTPMADIDPESSARPPAPAEQRHVIEGQFHLVDPRNGQPLAPPTSITTTVGGASPAGGL